MFSMLIGDPYRQNKNKGKKELKEKQQIKKNGIKIEQLCLGHDGKQKFDHWSLGFCGAPVYGFSSELPVTFSHLVIHVV